MLKLSVCNIKNYKGGLKMSISLAKGQKIDLTKGNAGLSKLMVGLGWDEMKQKSGFFSRPEPIDCDASVLMLDAAGKLADLVYFGQLNSNCKSVRHTGDNLTGAGSGDDEQVLIDLSQVPEHVNKIVFIVNIYDCVKRKQHFGMIKNAFIRVVNASSNAELVKFSLSEDYNNITSLFTGEIYRHNGEWKFNAIGDGTNDPGLKEIIARYR